MTRQIILDTETTGIGHEQGHRLIEIAGIELLDRRHTKKNVHFYLNPERLVDAGAFRVHGLSDAFLKDKPLFSEIADDFIAFVKGAELVIHNAAFDVGFINAELKRIKHPKKIEDYCTILDTLELARQKHPGQKNNLDALCKRYQVDASERVLHGALLDAEILADVYLAMTSGQRKLDFTEHVSPHKVTQQEHVHSKSPIYYANEEELAAHDDFLQLLSKKAGHALWHTCFGDKNEA